jgi:hypothetical protein
MPVFIDPLTGEEVYEEIDYDILFRPSQMGEGVAEALAGDNLFSGGRHPLKEGCGLLAADITAV